MSHLFLIFELLPCNLRCPTTIKTTFFFFCGEVIFIQSRLKTARCVIQLPHRRGLELKQTPTKSLVHEEEGHGTFHLLERIMEDWEIWGKHKILYVLSGVEAKHAWRSCWRYGSLEVTAWKPPGEQVVGIGLQLGWSMQLSGCFQQLSLFKLYINSVHTVYLIGPPWPPKAKQFFFLWLGFSFHHPARLFSTKPSNRRELRQRGHPSIGGLRADCFKISEVTGELANLGGHLATYRGNKSICVFLGGVFLFVFVCMCVFCFYWVLLGGTCFWMTQLTNWCSTKDCETRWYLRSLCRALVLGRFSKKQIARLGNFM